MALVLLDVRPQLVDRPTPRPSWPVAYTSTPQSSAAIRRMASRSCTPQSHRSEPSASPVRHSEWRRTRTPSLCSTLPRTMAGSFVVRGSRRPARRIHPRRGHRGTRATSVSMQHSRDVPFRLLTSGHNQEMMPSLAAAVEFAGPRQVQVAPVALPEPGPGCSAAAPASSALTRCRGAATRPPGWGSRPSAQRMHPAA